MSGYSGYADRSVGSQIADAWGHLAPEILCGSILAAVAVGLWPPPGLLMITVPFALMALVVASWLLMRRHDRQLCERCVASLPLDAAATAARYQWRFWTTHTIGQPKIVIPYIALLVATNFLPGTWGRIVWALAQCSMIYLIMSHVAHRRLQPWCPWCSDGGGGSDREDDVAPPPLPDNDRELV